METNGETTAGHHRSLHNGVAASNGVAAPKSRNGPSSSSHPAADAAQLKAIASEAIDAAASALNELSQEIWKHPELYFKEFKAHALLTDFLERSGFSVERSFKLKTAFRARYQSTAAGGGGTGGLQSPPPNVAVLCEYDALPKIGHACGHNLIAEVGIGAGIGVKAAMDASGVNLGQLTVLGCPAEEEGGGKVCMIEGGAFEGVDASLMSHPSNFEAVETKFAAMQEVRVTYRGVSSHAACDPAAGVNALDAAVMAYGAISCLRQQMKTAWRVHGIITKGGVAPNIIPDEAELFYYIRAPTNAQLDKLIARVTACFESAAHATGCTVEFAWDAHRYKDLITNAPIGDAYTRNARSLGVRFDCATPDNVGSTDMGNVSHVCPSIHPHFYFGAKHPEHSVGFAKQAGSVDAQHYAIREAKILAHTAIDLLCDPDLLAKAKADFESATANQ